MKLAKFNYVDLKGKQTVRQVLVTSMPTDKLSGIDVSELSDEDIAMLANELDEAHNDYLNRIESIKQRFDIKYNYRQFLEKSISHIQYEII